MRLFQFLIPSIFTNWLTPSLGTIGAVVSIASGVKSLISGGSKGGGGGGGSSSGSTTNNVTNQMPPDLSPGLTSGIPVPIHLAGEFSPNSQLYNTDVRYADGGIVFSPLSYYADGGPTTQARISDVGLGSLINPIPNETKYTAFAKGGEVEHHPEFYSEGGLKNTYVKGSGDGTSDSVPAMLANGEFVIPADVVSALGNGSSDSGSLVLDEFLKTIRDHKAKHDPNKLPPDSKGALTYLSIATKKVKS